MEGLPAFGCVRELRRKIHAKIFRIETVDGEQAYKRQHEGAASGVMSAVRISETGVEGASSI